MKRFAAALLIICLLFATSACNRGTATSPTVSPDPTKTPAPPSTAITLAPSPTPSPTPTPTPEPSKSPEPSYPIEADRPDAIYNAGKSAAMWLGMAQTELEANYKPQVVSKTGYTPYDGFGFFVKYWGNNTVLELALLLDGDRTNGGDWATSRGLKLGDSRETVKKLYDAPTAEADGVYFYYFLDGKLLFETPNIAKIDLNKYYSMRVMFTDDVVTSILFVRFQ